MFFSCHAINSYGEDRGLIQLTVQGTVWGLCVQCASVGLPSVAFTTKGSVKELGTQVASFSKGVSVQVGS